jgi:hypothetical protein
MGMKCERVCIGMDGSGVTGNLGFGSASASALYPVGASEVFDVQVDTTSARGAGKVNAPFRADGVITYDQAIKRLRGECRGAGYRESRIGFGIPLNIVNRAGGDRNMKDTRKTVYGAALVIATGCLAVGLIVLAGSFVSFQLDKDHASFWDTAVKAVGGLVALIGAAMAFSKYIDEREKANQAALIEAQKPFTSKRQEVYFQLLTATSMIGNKEDRSHPLR